MKKTIAPGNQTRSARVLSDHGPVMEPDMRLNIPRPLRRADLIPILDEGLLQAFRVVLDEALPDRFAVLLDALGRKGSDHDLPDPRLVR